jgi:hypothetical protein
MSLEMAAKVTQQRQVPELRGADDVEVVNVYNVFLLAFFYHHHQLRTSGSRLIFDTIDEWFWTKYASTFGTVTLMGT